MTFFLSALEITTWVGVAKSCFHVGLSRDLLGVPDGPNQADEPITSSNYMIELYIELVRFVCQSQHCSAGWSFFG